MMNAISQAIEALKCAQNNIAAHRPTGSADPESSRYDHDAFMWDYYQKAIDGLAQQDTPADAEVNAAMMEAGWQNSSIRQVDLPRVARVVRAMLSRYAPAQDAERERDYTRHLETALLDCAKVAILRGDVYLCDCIDNTGKRYQSQFLANLFARAQRADKGAS